MLTTIELLTTTSIALGLSADAVAVSMTSGSIIRHIRVSKALKIALFFGCFQGFMPIVGWLAGLTFRESLATVDHWIAFALLSFIGGKMIYEASRDTGERERFNPLDFYTLLGLAIATSLDALVAGLGLSVLKNSMLLACTLIGIITFILCFLGVFIGHKFGNFFNQKIEIIGGLVLIIIGSKILVEHLMV